MNGRYVAALGCGGRVRVMAVVIDGPAEEMRTRHTLAPNAAVVAAEGLVASVLLAAHVKGEERLSVDVQSEDPTLSFAADVNGDGTIRARMRPPQLPPGRTLRGMLSVAKSLGPRELYRGVSEVRGERFEAALQRYLTSSQQVDARVRIQADLDGEGRVNFAAGLLVERLPDFAGEEFAAVFDGAFAADFRELMTAFAFGQLVGEALEVLGTRDIVFACTCSRERVLTMIRSLGPDEIRSMIAEQGRAEVTCHYCNERYEVSEAELTALLSHFE